MTATIIKLGTSYSLCVDDVTMSMSSAQECFDYLAEHSRLTGQLITTSVSVVHKHSTWLQNALANYAQMRLTAKRVALARTMIQRVFNPTH